MARPILTIVSNGKPFIFAPYQFSVEWNQIMNKSYRPRLSAIEVMTLLYLVKEKRQILRYKYERASPEEKVFIGIWKEEYKRLLRLLRKFERLDPLNFGFNERWKHKRIPKELARLRLAEGIAEMRSSPK